MKRQLLAGLWGCGLVLLTGLNAFGQIQGGTGSGTSGIGDTSGITASDSVGTITGTERFIRGNRQMGQLVGGGATAVGNVGGAGGVGGTGSRTTGMGGGMFGGGMFGGGGGMFNPMNQMMAGMMNNMSRQRRQLRMPMYLGTELSTSMATTSAESPAKITERVQTRLTKIPQIRDNNSVKIKMDGKVAVLTGQVKSQRDRDVIGRLLLLEPGVSDVRNELVVNAPKKAP